MPLPAIPFAKMNGIGNAILVADLRGTGQTVTGDAAAAIAREPGLGFDQLMAIEAPQRTGTDAFVRIFNNDGSSAGACGNGTRCVAWMMLRDTPKTDLLLQSPGGDLVCHRLGDTTFSVDMGVPRFGWRDIPLCDPVTDTTRVPLVGAPAVPGLDLSRFCAVSMGNPHAVFFVPDATAIDLAAVGAAIELNPLFPDRTNVSFATPGSDGSIVLRTWERGAGATLACGSAACAALVASVRLGWGGRIAAVHQRGGTLTIEWRAGDDHVIMTGPVELEREGTLPLDLPGLAA